MTITESCGCSKRRITEGLPTEGWLIHYCAAHNPYKNMTPKVTL